MYSTFCKKNKKFFSGGRKKFGKHFPLQNAGPFKQAYKKAPR
ncbi:hypothetical protein B4098_0241 [Heyndrickxia coagulans]|uniref:Uncharacterized protein n=1 Tax=Heyndrickxia coagulans TaxID=1398 RepID=A0A150K7V4_HEYCO|nr:hypothetical protein B4098_0241 [Heyndrickxia coagulans]